MLTPCLTGDKKNVSKERKRKTQRQLIALELFHLKSLEWHFLDYDALGGFEIIRINNQKA